MYDMKELKEKMMEGLSKDKLKMIIDRQDQKIKLQDKMIESYEKMIANYEKLLANNEKMLDLKDSQLRSYKILLAIAEAKNEKGGD